MKELQFRPEKMGFLAWECRVKMPGRPNRYYPVRALTKRGAKRKATKAHNRLLSSYTYRSGLSKRGKTITKEIPELPPDAPRVVDTDGPRSPRWNDIEPLEPIFRPVDSTYTSTLGTQDALRPEKPAEKAYDLTTGRIVPVKDDEE
jgi:hypothetical protein